MDGAVPFARRSPTKLPGGCQQRSLLLLRLWPRRGRDSLCGNLSPGEVLAGLGVAAPMARGRASVAGGGTFLSNPIASPQRGGLPIAPTPEPARGALRTHSCLVAGPGVARG